MHRLDPRTLEEIAKVICDLGGPHERRGRELERLLRHAGWSDPPEYDGSYRIPWLTEVLEERADDHQDIVKVLQRSCDPLEYGASTEVAEEFRDALNAALEPEGVSISLIGGRPTIASINGISNMPVFALPGNLAARLGRLINDRQLVDILVDRAEQSSAAQSAGAHLLAVIGIGSFVEGVLLAVLLQRDPNVVLLNYKKQPVSPDRAGLESLLDAAHRDEHIALDAHAFLNQVRNFRNYIHPRRQQAEKFMPDGETVSLCWGPVHAVLNDLEQSAP